MLLGIAYFTISMIKRTQFQHRTTTTTTASTINEAMLGKVYTTLFSRLLISLGPHSSFQVPKHILSNISIRLDTVYITPIVQTSLSASNSKFVQVYNFGLTSINNTSILDVFHWPCPRMTVYFWARKNHRTCIRAVNRIASSMSRQFENLKHLFLYIWWSRVFYGSW